MILVSVGKPCSFTTHSVVKQMASFTSQPLQWNFFFLFKKLTSIITLIFFRDLKDWWVTSQKPRQNYSKRYLLQLLRERKCMCVLGMEWQTHQGDFSSNKAKLTRILLRQPQDRHDIYKSGVQMKIPWQPSPGDKGTAWLLSCGYCKVWTCPSPFWSWLLKEWASLVARP